MHEKHSELYICHKEILGWKDHFRWLLKGREVPNGIKVCEKMFFSQCELITLSLFWAVGSCSLHFCMEELISEEHHFQNAIFFSSKII